MPKIEKRVHTPLVSEKQRGLFGAELARRRAGEEGRMPGITEEELARHLRESKGKDLPGTTSKLCKKIDDFVKAFPNVCANCGAKIYTGFGINKCPKCKTPWKEKIEKKREQFGERISPVERRLEEEELITPEKTDWREFTGGRAVTRPGSETPKGTYRVGPRGGTSRHTGEPWRRISYRGGAHYVKQLLKSVNGAINTLEDKIVNDMRNEIKTDNTQRAKQLAENISSRATGEQIRKQKIREPFAVATAQVKRMGFTDLSEGSEGARKRDEIAEALMREKKVSKSIDEFIEKQEMGPGQRKKFIRTHKLTGSGGVREFERKTGIKVHPEDPGHKPYPTDDLETYLTRRGELHSKV